MSLAKKISLRERIFLSIGEEKIITIIRPYLITYGWKYFVGLAFLFVSSFFMFRLFFYGWWGYIVYGLGMFLGIYIILRAWFMANKNILVITSERVADIHRLGWWDEIISSVNYLDIKDVVVRKKGIGQNLFDFGGLAIATKSQQFILEILNIRHPQKIQTLLADLAQQYRQDRKVASTRVIYENFIKIIPDLPDADLARAQKLIHEQIADLDKETPHV